MAKVSAIIILFLAAIVLSIGFSPLFAVLLAIPVILGYLWWVGASGVDRPENIKRGGQPIEEVPQREADVHKSADELRKDV